MEAAGMRQFTEQEKKEIWRAKVLQDNTRWTTDEVRRTAAERGWSDRKMRRHIRRVEWNMRH
jgi:hypothetical protein